MTILPQQQAQGKRSSPPMKKEDPLGHEETMEVVSSLGGDDDDASHEDDVLVPKRGELAWIVNAAKNVLSASLLLFSCILITAAVFEQQTRATGPAFGLHPAAAFVLFLVALLWLAVIEGGLNCVVGLRPVVAATYQESHPIAYRCTAAAHKGENLERFIVGRQYMDLSMVFTISFLVSALKGASVLGLPDIVCNVFLGSGLAMVLVTIVFGQLVMQINSADCMLDYMNNRIMLLSTYLALAVEASGICHAAYLIQIVATKMAGKEVAQEHKTLWQKFTFWLRVTLSVVLLLFALVTVFTAIFRGETKMFDGVPSWVSVLLFVGLILLVGMMDALQIAICAVVYIPEEQLWQHPTALRNMERVRGKRLRSFLLGRQIGQTVVQFLLARITTLDVPIGENDNIWGVSDLVQKMFNGGVLGAIIATVLASLSWRVLASNFPLAFLSSPFSRPIIGLCLLAERTGVINIAWSLAAVHRKVAGFKPDEYYLGGDMNGKRELDDAKDATAHQSDEETGDDVCPCVKKVEN